MTSLGKLLAMGQLPYILGVFLFCLAWGWAFTSLIDKD